MKKVVFILMMVFAVYTVNSQNNNIHIYSLKVPGYQNPSQINSGIPLSDVSEVYDYADGLGRSVQTVLRRSSPSGNDMILPKILDAFGRDVTNYLPYKNNTTSGGYDNDVEEHLTDYYMNEPGIAHSQYPMSPVAYEESPLSRLLKSGHPGLSGQLESDNIKKFEYGLNLKDDFKYGKVSQWIFNQDDKSCTRSSEYYSEGVLFVGEVIDEDGNSALQFSNTLGQVLLKRSILDEERTVDTYFIYDDLGLLRYIITPEGSKALNGNTGVGDPIGMNYIYYFEYDSKNRLIKRMVPGRDVEYFVYDKKGRLVLYQDGNSRSAEKWLFYKYDFLGRKIIIGETYYGVGMTLEELQLLAESQPYNDEILMYHDFNNNMGYSDRYFRELLSNGVINIVNYYDTYKICEKNGNNKIYHRLPSDDQNLMIDMYFDDFHPDTVNIDGLITAQRIRVIENGVTTWKLTTQYYDVYGRSIQIRHKNFRDGYDYITTHYLGLTSNPDHTKHQQTTRLGTYGYSVVEESWIEYDHAGRIKNKFYKINNSARRQVFSYNYNSLGQLSEQNIGEETDVLQSIDYIYNIRGWLKSINDAALSSGENDLFGEELFYDEQDIGLTSHQLKFNGDIAAIKWQTAGITGQKAYTYQYDKLDRLTDATYHEKSASSWSESNLYSERMSYDYNGNISSLVRRGLVAPNNIPGEIDNLSYYLLGNRLMAVNDQVTVNNGGDFFDNGNVTIPNPLNENTWEMKYDKNGNLKSDANKKIVSITYNNFNQPLTIDFVEGSRIVYLYDGSGTRLKKTVIRNGSPATVTDYVGNFVYQDNVLAFGKYPEGRIVFYKKTMFAEFYLSDHLGNVRVAFTRNASNGQVVLRQVNGYYPYGMNIKGLSGYFNTTAINEYLFQGKEFDNELDLNWFDFHARMYDPVLGRWHVQDPMMQYVSGYAAMGDNPVSMIDPSGMSTDKWPPDWWPFGNGECRSFEGGIRWDKIGTFFDNLGEAISGIFGNCIGAEQRRWIWFNYSGWGSIAEPGLVSGYSSAGGGGVNKGGGGGIGNGSGNNYQPFNLSANPQSNHRTIRPDGDPIGRYVNAMFPGRVPSNAKIVWKLTDEEDGHTDYMTDNSLNVNIPKKMWYSQNKIMLIDCLDHELVHIDDYISGRYDKWYNRYGEDITKQIMDYRAYKENLYYHTFINPNIENNDQYIESYKRKITVSEKYLPYGWWE
jgi:RHS repeat-associated protein